jgi:hypothetical protein
MKRDANKLDQLLRLLGFADPSAAIEEFSSLAPIVGQPSSEAESYWDFLEYEEPSNKDIAERLREAEAANDPLVLLTGEFGFLRGALNASMRRRWSSASARNAGHPKSLARISWTELGEESRDDVRRAILALAQYHDRFVSGLGRPVKDRINQLLLQLAEIFARHTGFQGSYMELPASPNSRFIRFAEAVLEASQFDKSERTAKALARRWHRLRKAQLCVEARTAPSIAKRPS